MLVLLGGKEAARDAVRFLEGPSEGRVLLLAMLVGAADETLVIARVFNNEEVDISTQPSTLQSFLKRIRALFGDDRRCFELPGLTSAAPRVLEWGLLPGWAPEAAPH
eukprot:10144351-Lingulodinium_polyedra.AAC.1